MKTMISVLGLALALVFTTVSTAPVFGADVTKSKTQADCERAGGTWDAQKSTCSEKKM